MGAWVLICAYVYSRTQFSKIELNTHSYMRLLLYTQLVVAARRDEWPFKRGTNEEAKIYKLLPAAARTDRGMANRRMVERKWLLWPPSTAYGNQVVKKKESTIVCTSDGSNRKNVLRTHCTHTTWSTGDSTKDTIYKSLWHGFKCYVSWDPFVSL